MIFKKSVTEKVSAKLAPIARKLMNVSLRMLGYPTQILRITESSADLMGDTTYTLSSQIVNNVIIDLPFGEVEMLATKDTADQSGTGFSLMELLTIDMYVPFEGTQGQDAIQLDKNDIIVLVIFDAYGNKLPIRFQGPKLVTGMIGRYEGYRRYELTLVRGILEDDIETRIDDYVDNLGVPSVSSTDPDDDEEDVAVDSTIAVTFNMTMTEADVESAISISPTVTYTSSWDDDSKVLTMTPSSNLTVSTEYTIRISTKAQSEANVPFASSYSFSLITEE